MFDTYTRTTEFITKEVHEHRAPTDESIKILREMELAAQQKVLEAIRLENCEIDGVLHCMKHTLSFDYMFKFIFSVNGKKMCTDYSVSEWDIQKNDFQWVQGLITKVAETIAEEILRKPLIKALGEMKLQGLIHGK